MREGGNATSRKENFGRTAMQKIGNVAHSYREEMQIAKITQLCPRSVVICDGACPGLIHLPVGKTAGYSKLISRRWKIEVEHSVFEAEVGAEDR